MVNANTTITFSVAGTTAGIVPVSARDVRTSVADRLSLYFDVLALTITPPSWLEGIVNVEWLHWSYTASVTIKTRVDHGDIDDVRSVIAHAFYVGAGAMPTVSVPAAGEIAQVDPVAYPGIVNPLDTMFTAFQRTEVLLIAGVLGIVALIMFSPAGKAGARSLGSLRLV